MTRGCCGEGSIQLLLFQRRRWWGGFIIIIRSSSRLARGQCGRWFFMYRERRRKTKIIEKDTRRGFSIRAQEKEKQERARRLICHNHPTESRYVYVVPPLLLSRRCCLLVAAAGLSLCQSLSLHIQYYHTTLNNYLADCLYSIFHFVWCLARTIHDTWSVLCRSVSFFLICLACVRQWYIHTYLPYTHPVRLACHVLLRVNEISTIHFFISCKRWLTDRRTDTKLGRRYHGIPPPTIL